MRIDKEGYGVIWKSALILAVLTALAFLFLPLPVGWIVMTVALILLFFDCYFFRSPDRGTPPDPRTVFSAADGEVVAIEEVAEKEYFGGEPRLMVSVFMSIWNVHANWYPVSGRVAYFKHHHGRYLVAWHPKSSEENERTTTVVDTGREEVLFRQIAGMVARRIVSYATEGGEAGQNTRCGFIKFGSRVDIYLPPDAEILVAIGDRVRGAETPLAKLAGTPAANLPLL